jgi:uncharacterized membrane protein (DUF485 family)
VLNFITGLTVGLIICAVVIAILYERIAREYDKATRLSRKASATFTQAEQMFHRALTAERDRPC